MRDKAISALVLSIISFGLLAAVEGKEQVGMRAAANTVLLPVPKVKGELSVEAAMAKRRSVRAFQDKAITTEMLSQLLWSLQGISDRAGYRTVPSAGALYPIEIYVAMKGGLYHYYSLRNEITRKSSSDLRPALARAALGQEAVAEAPAVFIIAAVYERTTLKYGAQRGERYVHLECGHAAQNILLEAVSLGLGAVPIGAFRDADVAKVLQIPFNEHVIYLIPVGYAL